MPIYTYILSTFKKKKKGKKRKLAEIDQVCRQGDEGKRNES